MGLKQNIYNAFVTNLGEEHISNSSEGQTKVDTLATDLTTAIAKYINEVDFRIEDLKAEGLILPGGINTVGSPAAQSNVAPVTLKVQTSKTKNEVGLPQTLTNANTSLVKVDKNSNRSKSGVNV